VAGTESTPTVADWRSQPLVVASPPRGLIAGTKYSLNALKAQRELIGLLVQREIKSRYKDSALGVVWSLFRPLVQLMIFYIAVGKFLGAERSIPEFAIFVFAGLTAWGLFYEVLQGATGSIVSNAGLIKKVYLPREIFPLAATGSALFNFGVQFVVLLAATVVLGRAPLTLEFFYAPLAAVLLLAFAFAIGLLFSAVNVYFRDMQHLVEVLLLVLFWASPIVYSYEFVHKLLQGNWLEQIYLANPITIGVMGFQRGMWIAGTDQMWPPDLTLRMVLLTFLSIALVWVSQRIFARLEGNFAQEI
jgi:ABC-2 type transport system permease protein